MKKYTFGVIIDSINEADSFVRVASTKVFKVRLKKEDGSLNISGKALIAVMSLCAECKTGLTCVVYDCTKDELENFKEELYHLGIEVAETSEFNEIKWSELEGYNE